MSVLGIDVSKWQLLMDWLIAKAAGAKFAFIRAGFTGYTGSINTDPQFERNAEIAPDFMPVGFYWYFRPQFNPEKQADYFCDLIREKDWKLPPVLDLEAAGELAPVDVTESAASFVLRVNENLGVIPLLYSRGAWLNKNTVPDDLMKLMDLWIARYTFKKKPWGNLLPYPDWPGIKPRDYPEWLFWQWSADGNGRGPEFGASSKSIDLNRYNGDQAAFDDYYKTEPPPEPVFELPATVGVKLQVGDVKYRGHVEKVE